MTNNSFADFLLDSQNDGIFDMLNEDLQMEVYKLFDEPLYLMNNDGQSEILEVAGPIFEYEFGNHGNKIFVGNEFGSKVDNRTRFTLGDLLVCDWYTDEFIFHEQVPDWCLRPTYELIRDIVITIISSRKEYTVKLHACDRGFQKCGYSWESISPPVRFIPND